ncbi:Golgi apparatus membrane protein tvp18 [Mortierella alpina]|nr:Golgi apparatus membrane protein tvp18 [Mortierella alpina]
MAITDELKSGNFSLYGQWCGLLSIVVLPDYDDFLTKFHNSYLRAGAYLVFCILMWIAVGVGHRGLQAISAVLLTLAALAYGFAAVKGQAPASSTITGGTGVSTIV